MAGADGGEDVILISLIIDSRTPVPSGVGLVLQYFSARRDDLCKLSETWMSQRETSRETEGT